MQRTMWRALSESGDVWNYRVRPGSTCRHFFLGQRPWHNTHGV